MFQLIDTTTSTDLTPYLVALEWAGDMKQAGRRISFSIAYTTPDKDSVWNNVTVSVGDTVTLTYIDDKTSAPFVIFIGRVFLRDRHSESFTMEFTAYDHLIYAAKSKIQTKFDNLSARDVITQVCGIVGITPGDLSCKDLDQKVSFIADAMTGTEAIEKALELVKAVTTYKYHVYMAPDTEGKQKLNVVRADNTVATILSNNTNITAAEHGESIESMINQVAVCDSAGNITGYVKNEDDIKAYGLIQDVYKASEKQNSERAAKAMLRKTAENSHIDALGDIQCISGYAVTVQEEQISGKFLIESDTHRIQDNVHTMSLELTYLIDPDQAAGATTEGNVNPVTIKGGAPAGGYSNSESGVYSKLKELGLTDNQAAGVMGNIKAEDTGFDPTTQNEAGYTGLFQLDPNDRWPRYVKFCEEHGWDPYNDSNQVEYVLRYENGDIRSQIPDDPQQAAKWFNENVEISGDTSGTREGYANDYKAAMDAGTLKVESKQQSGGSYSGGGLESQMQAADSAWIGQTTPYHSNGCVYAATGYASYYSPWAAKQFSNCVVYVPTLVQNAKNDGMYSTDFSKLEAGDIIVYGDNDHVVVARGGESYVGNSSSKDQVVNGGNFYNMGGLYPVGIIKTSHA